MSFATMLTAPPVQPAPVADLSHGGDDLPPVPPQDDHDGDSRDDDDHEGRYPRYFYPTSREIFQGELQPGQRVYCGLRPGRYGIVYKIDGVQMPETIRVLGRGGVTMGGRATLDVIFDNGSRSRAVPECIVRGVQWEIYDSVATAEEIMDAVDYCHREEAERERERLEADERRAKERIDHAANYPHLLKKTDRPDWSPGRLAAENIRRELKREFPAIKFSVRSDYNSVDCYWTDGPTTEQVDAITGKYDAGSFNGMEDIYEYDQDATFGDVFGDPRYTFSHRSQSVEGLRQAWAMDGGKPDDVPGDWNDGGRWKIDNELGERIARQWSVTDLTPRPVVQEVAATTPAPPAKVFQATLTINTEKHGIELRFPSKPAADVLATLKAHGWRWTRFGGCWYAKDTPEQRQLAEQFTK